MIKRLFKWVNNRRKWNRTRKISDYRATSLAVKLVLSGSLQPTRRGVSMLTRMRRSITI